MGQSQEVILRYAFGEAGGGRPNNATTGTTTTWVSDSNCREGLRRATNWRPQWNYSGSEPVAANYYPTSCLIRADSGGATLAVATDRAQGSTSLAQGQLELMVHRRMLHDDGRGVGEALNEPGVDGKGLVVRGAHWVVLAPEGSPLAVASYKAAQVKALSLPTVIRAMAPLPFNTTPSQWLLQYKGRASCLMQPLPPSLHLTTLQSLESGKLLLRLTHVYDLGESGAQEVSLDLKNTVLLPPGRSVISAIEMTLPASMPLASVQPFNLTTDVGDSFQLPMPPSPPQGSALTVSIAPGQVRTFLLSF